MKRCRKLNGGTWINVEDTNDGRKRLVHYSSIPENTKEIYKLPNSTTLIQKVKNEKDFDKIDQKQCKIDIESMQILSILKDAAEKQYIKFCPKYLKLFPSEPDKVIIYARTHAVASALLTLRYKHKLRSLQGGYMQIAGLKSYVTNYAEFCKKMSQWAENGINLIHKLTGTDQKHLKKVTDFHIGKMEQYYSHPNQYTYSMITELTNADCKAIGLKEISIESVKKYLGQPSVKNRLSYYRSKEFFKKNVQPFARRKESLFSGDLYYADGSPLQIFSWNKEHTKKIRLNLFAVMDVKSSKIVGFDLAESEDRYNWFAAFKMGFDMEMLLPYEVVYDNASATKTQEFKTLKEKLLVRGCRFNPAEKGNPQHKAQLERWFGTFQSTCQRMIDGYIGEGIRSKRTNGRIDAEFWGKAVRKDDCYTWDSMVMIITQLISVYNQKAAKNRKAPSKVFAESEKPNAPIIGKEDIAQLFYHSKKLKISRSELKHTVRHVDYYYEVFDHTQGLKLNGKEVITYYNEGDLSTVHIFSLQNEYLGELRQKIGLVQGKANQQPSDVQQIIKTSKHNNSISTTVRDATQKIADKAAAINQDAFYNISNPFTVAKETFNTAETKLMMDYVSEHSDVNSERVKPYTPIAYNTPLSKRNDKKPLTERYSKQFQDKNPDLSVVEQK
ncbi:hypothetical protein [Pedobacter sp. UYP30]|uniref:hypothetical protein n=1 Tax=Pedobacter sp. UYP30 TaxID=1756400 RepID=UPI003393308D